MPIPKTEKIWHNGKFINWDDAKIHVLSHVVSYGSAVFEGIRCYGTAQGPAIFRNREHMQRLLNSAYIYRMEVPFSLDELCEANLELVRVNKVARAICARSFCAVMAKPAWTRKDARSKCIWLAGSGENIWAKKACGTASTSASVRGIVPRRTLCRKWPRPPRIT